MRIVIDSKLLKDVIVENLMGSGEGILDDEGVDDVVCQQIADNVVSQVEYEKRKMEECTLVSVLKLSAERFCPQVIFWPVDQIRNMLIWDETTQMWTIYSYDHSNVVTPSILIFTPDLDEAIRVLKGGLPYERPQRS